MTRSLAAARNVLGPLGLEIKLSSEWGEFRVNFKGGREATAYYTDDLDDAVATGRAMAENKSGRRSPWAPEALSL